MTDRCLFGLGNESVERMTLIAEGNATEGNTGQVGLLHFVFPREDGDIHVKFVYVSSVLYFDELFADKSSYPYEFHTYEKNGLYECIGSSYLDRITTDLHITGGMFQKNRHFVYFNDDFYWHITAEGIEVTKLGNA